MLEGKKIRVLTALPGIEGHDRGITLINQALRDAGMEVIYLGRFNTPIKIVKAAMEEDVEFIGLSYLGDHLYMKSLSYQEEYNHVKLNFFRVECELKE